MPPPIFFKVPPTASSTFVVVSGAYTSAAIYASSGIKLTSAGIAPIPVAAKAPLLANIPGALLANIFKNPFPSLVFASFFIASLAAFLSLGKPLIGDIFLLAASPAAAIAPPTTGYCKIFCPTASSLVKLPSGSAKNISAVCLANPFSLASLSAASASPADCAALTAATVFGSAPWFTIDKTLTSLSMSDSSSVSGLKKLES